MCRLLLVTLLLALATGCTSASSRGAFAHQDDRPTFAADQECDATNVQSYVGQRWRDALNADLRRASTSQMLRLLKPGQVMTMELNPYRLNVVIDAQGVIESLYCS